MKLHQLYAHLAQAKADGDTALIARLQDAISGRIDAITGASIPKTKRAPEGARSKRSVQRQLTGRCRALRTRA